MNHGYETVLVSKPSPTDKPLPSVPVLTISTGATPKIARRSLIDAADEPLCTTPPLEPAKVTQGDQWPVLFSETQKTSCFSQQEHFKSAECVDTEINQGDTDSESVNRALPKPTNESDSQVEIGLALSPETKQVAVLDTAVPSKVSAKDNPKRSSLSATFHEPILSQRRSLLNMASLNEQAISANDVPKATLKPQSQQESAIAHHDQFSPRFSQNLHRRRQDSPRVKGIPHATKAHPVLTTINASQIRKRRALIDKKGSPHQNRSRSLQRPASSPPKFASLLDLLDNGSTNRSRRRSSTPLPIRLVHSNQNQDERHEIDTGSSKREAIENTGKTSQSETLAARPATDQNVSTPRHGIESDDNLDSPDVNFIIEDETVISGKAPVAVPATALSPSGYRIKHFSSDRWKMGPTLRISNSAEKLLIGESEDEDQPLIMRAEPKERNSVPDLRRSTLVKELGRSASGVMRGSIGLPRSLTSRSLSKIDREEKFMSGLEEPLLGDEGGHITHDPFTQDKPTLQHSTSDWPLKTHGGSPKSQSDDDDDPWISPVQIMKQDTTFGKKMLSPVIESPLSIRNVKQSPELLHSTPTTAAKTANATEGSMRPSFPIRTSSLSPPSATKEVSPEIMPIGTTTKADFQRILSHESLDAGVETATSPQLTDDSSISTSKSMVSGLRGLFHRRDNDTPALNSFSPTATSSTDRKSKLSLAAYSKSLPPRKYATTRNQKQPKAPSAMQNTTSALPTALTTAFDTPRRSEDEAILTLTMRVLNLAQTERNNDSKERYVEVSQPILQISRDC